MILQAGGSWKAELETILVVARAATRDSASEVLLPLRNYDREHGGDLVHTLFTYLSLGCNATRAAEALFLHRSGLLYRLRRIEGLLSVRLDDFKTRVALEIALLAGDVED